jgi:hypothetical protein
MWFRKDIKIIILEIKIMNYRTDCKILYPLEINLLKKS